MKKRKLPMLTKSDFYENFCERLLIFFIGLVHAIMAVSPVR